MNKSGYNIPLLLYSFVKKHIPAWTKKEQMKFALKSKTDGHHLLKWAVSFLLSLFYDLIQS
jgi:hypothetical protein